MQFFAIFTHLEMGKKQAYHDEVELEDFEFDDEEETYYYPCPCGDRFAITLQELHWGLEVATCPSCSLIVKVIYDLADFEEEEDEQVKDLSKDLTKSLKVEN